MMGRITNTLFGKPKDTGYRIGFVAMFLIAIALVLPTFISLEGLQDVIYSYQSLMLAGLVMTIFFSSMLRSSSRTQITGKLNAVTVTKQMAVLTTGIVAGVILVLVNVVTNMGGNLLLNSVSGEIPYDALMLGILAGVSEELFFRGFIQTMIRVYVPSLVFAIIPSALIFATFHYFTYTEPIAFLVLFILGLGLGLLYEMFNDIGVPMVAHIVNNIFAMLPLVMASLMANMPILMLLIGAFVFAYLYAVNSRRR